MINNIKHKRRALAAAVPALFLTACVNHMENGEYISTGEIMAGAFANLLIGMGTVFAVLIFLTWVISLFKHVGKLEKALTASGRKTSKQTGRRRKRKASQPEAETAAEMAQPAAENAAAQAVSITPAPAGDELQAVIAAAIAAYEADMAAVMGGPAARPKQPALQNGIRIQTYRRA